MGGCQWFGKSTIFKLVGQGGLTKKANKLQEDSRCKGIQGKHPKQKLNEYA